MKIIRNNVFETNSSSTHSISIIRDKNTNYIPDSDVIMVKFIDTDKETVLNTLEDKISYLVSQIINRYKYDYKSYNELKSRVEETYDFDRIKCYVEYNFGKKVVLPESYDTEYTDEDGELYESPLCDIVNINHQIVCDSLNDLLKDLVLDERDLLDDVLNTQTVIVFGRD